MITLLTVISPKELSTSSKNEKIIELHQIENRLNSVINITKKHLINRVWGKKYPDCPKTRWQHTCEID